MPAERVVPLLSRLQKVVLAMMLVLSVTATVLVLFGPARGAREDLGAVRTDLHSTRAGIYSTLGVQRRTLARITAQLRTTQTSLEIQQEGLTVARTSQQLAGRTTRSTEAIRRQTAQTLATLRRVIAALGPLRELRGDLTTVVTGVRAGVELARTTLQVARQSLSDGRKALAVAVSTLTTLKRSEQVQRDLLEVGRQTLAQVVEINRKIPSAPIFPATTPGSAVGRDR